MKVKILASSAGRGMPHQHTISYSVDGRLAIDAGCIGLVTPLEDQKRIRHVFLSHTHIDHIASLPLFLDNVFEPGEGCPTVYGSESVLNCLRQDVFNGRLWPDLAELSEESCPIVRFETLQSERPVEVDGYRVTPIDVNHIVPTFGFVVEDAHAAVVFSSDTGPTERLWEMARALPRLKAVFLEASFPDALSDLAEKSAHLTPRLLAAELAKLNRPEVPVVVVHTKLAYRDDILRQLETLDLPPWQLGRLEHEYDFR